MKTEFIKKSMVAALTSAALLAVLPMSASAVVTANASGAKSQASSTTQTAKSPKIEWDYLHGEWSVKLDNVNVIGWFESENNWYYFNTQGIMVHNTTLKIDGKEYTFDNDGICKNKR